MAAIIGILLFAVLAVADIVRYIMNDEEFDTVMLFGRPIVAFFAALLCDGTFWEAVLWAVGWGIAGAVFSTLLSGHRADPLPEEDDDFPADDEEEDVQTPPAPPKPKVPAPPAPPKPKVPAPPPTHTGPVYRDDIFSISNSKLIKCLKNHDYIRIPEGVTVIGQGVFRNHTHLRRVILPDTLHTIEKEAFCNCTQLEELVLPEGLVHIEQEAFHHCRSLKQVHFPGTLKEVSKYAFTNCSELTAVSFAEDCAATVGFAAFSSCHKLRSFTIPDMVKLGNPASFPFFSGHDEKTTVRCYAGSNAYFEALRVGATCVLLDGKEYDPSCDFVLEAGALKYYIGKNPDVTIPEGTRIIRSGAFQQNKEIVRVFIPDSVTTIEAGAFSLCTHLRSVRLPKGLTCIPEEAFCWCSALCEITFPQGLTTIDARAFAGTSLGAAQLPDSLKSIGKGAFSYCHSLTDIHIPASVYPAEDILDNSLRAVIVAAPGSKAAQYAKDHAISLRHSSAQPPRLLKSEELPGNIRRTYYETLQPSEKMAYGVLVQALLQMDSQCSFAGIPALQATGYSLRSALEADYPEIFWVNWSALDRRIFEGGTLTNVYSVTKEQRNRMQQQIEAFVNPFLASVPRQLGEYEKAKRAYDWITDKLEYDHTGLKAQESSQYDSVTSDDLRNIYGAFVKKKVVCVGYALAYQYLLQKLGVEAVMRSGGRSLATGHAWTCAKLEGDYYHIDATNGDGFTPGYEFFGLTDDEMYKHQGSLRDLTKHIRCNAIRCSYYAKEGLYPERIDKADLLERIRRYLSKHYCRNLELKFSNMLQLDQAEELLLRDDSIQQFAKEQGFFMVTTTKEYRHNLLAIRFF